MKPSTHIISIAERAREKGLRMTPQRVVIANVIDASEDHPDAEEICIRAKEHDAKISLATIYRTLKQFEDEGILDRLDFGDGRARFEDAKRAHHDHLLDMDTGEVIEFVDPEVEALQEKIAKRLGFELIGHKFELYGKKIKS